MALSLERRTEELHLPAALLKGEAEPQIYTALGSRHEKQGEMETRSQAEMQTGRDVRHAQQGVDTLHGACIAYVYWSLLSTNYTKVQKLKAKSNTTNPWEHLMFTGCKSRLFQDSLTTWCKCIKEWSTIQFHTLNHLKCHMKIYPNISPP